MFYIKDFFFIVEIYEEIWNHWVLNTATIVLQFTQPFNFQDYEPLCPKIFLVLGKILAHCTMNQD